MSLEAVYQNGVVVLDPSGPPIPDGTRVEVTPRTGMEPHITKTPGVCGGNACVGGRRIAVWSLVASRDLGIPDATLLADFDPPLTPDQLAAAWRYAAANADEITAALRANNEA